jgi:hypothetical protein
MSGQGFIRIWSTWGDVHRVRTSAIVESLCPLVALHAKAEVLEQ